MSTTINRYRIHGIIKLTSPLHIASPRKKRIDEGGREVFGQQGTPCTPIITLDLPFARSIEKKMEDGGGNKIIKWQLKVPVIPANNQNGHLRRHAAAVVFDELRKRGEKVNIETYSAMTCGAVTGVPDAGMVKFDEYREARENVFLGLFGGGPRMIRRSVRIHNAVPVTDDTLKAGLHSGVTRHPAFDGPESLELTARIPDGVEVVKSWFFRRNDDLASLADVTLQEAAIENYLEKIQEYQAKILEEGAKEEEGSRFSTRTWTAMEFVIPGVMFPMTCELEVTDAQMGLFLLALDRYAEIDRLGGCSRNGFGMFLLQNMVLVTVATGETTGELFKDGRLNRAEDGPAYPFLAAFRLAAQELSVERLNHLMRPPAEKPKKAGKKSAKAAGVEE